MCKRRVGTYHMEYEYTIDGTEESYPYLRNAIPHYESTGKIINLKI